VLKPAIAHGERDGAMISTDFIDKASKHKISHKCISCATQIARGARAAAEIN